MIWAADFSQDHPVAEAQPADGALVPSRDAGGHSSSVCSGLSDFAVAPQFCRIGWQRAVIRDSDLRPHLAPSVPVSCGEQTSGGVVVRRPHLRLVKLVISGTALRHGPAG